MTPRLNSISSKEATKQPAQQMHETLKFVVSPPALKCLVPPPALEVHEPYISHESDASGFPRAFIADID